MHAGFTARVFVGTAAPGCPGKRSSRGFSFINRALKSVAGLRPADSRGGCPYEG